MAGDSLHAYQRVRHLALATLAFCMAYRTQGREASAACNRLCKNIYVYQVCSNAPMYGQYRYPECAVCPNANNSLCTDAANQTCQDFSAPFFQQQIRNADPGPISCDCPANDNTVLWTEVQSATDGGTWTDCNWKTCQGNPS